MQAIDTTRTVEPTPDCFSPRTQNLCDRTIRIEKPRTWLQKAALKAQDWLERRVADVSVHGDPPVYDTRVFPWAAEIESEWRMIRLELDQVMTFRDQIPSFHEILKEVGAITTDDSWKTYFLAGIGMNCEENAKRCPETARLLRKIPGMKTAFFSILSPRKHIPAHRGAFNGILRFHLGLLVPNPREKVRIRIGNDFHHWTEGKALIFDDTFNHEVWNDTNGYRVVLFVDFTRPLKQPYHRINETFLSMASFAPFLREAGNKQRTWEKKFYQRQASSG
ncbi:MAG: aspartyl/asparaginyl beta-hydroxylase domain-containing protein [Verrucomicrobia bacterium]|nr:aspartyl/asparaginyl beta-hydroxylase domain-containing protein [Verrucomicrobiota bacterium]MBI3868888.1 aspartyl/asparaginyl beta-hydroxylase domain-containing protein [Verrucomicrobiota bacterium]